MYCKIIQKQLSDVGFIFKQIHLLFQNTPAGRTG